MALQELDLSSLETISGGGVLAFNNPQLCYVGNLSRYLTNPSEQHQCFVSDRRDPQTCSENTVNLLIYNTGICNFYLLAMCIPDLCTCSTLHVIDSLLVINLTHVGAEVLVRICTVVLIIETGDGVCCHDLHQKALIVHLNSISYWW